MYDKYMLKFPKLFDKKCKKKTEENKNKFKCKKQNKLYKNFKCCVSIFSSGNGRTHNGNIFENF